MIVKLLRSDIKGHLMFVNIGMLLTECSPGHPVIAKRETKPTKQWQDRNSTREKSMSILGFSVI